MSEKYLPYELWKITEYRNECVYKTETMGVVWIPIGLAIFRDFQQKNQLAKELGGDRLGSLSTSHEFAGSMLAKDMIPTGEKIWEHKPKGDKP